jgi:hypothetical protein
MHKSEEIAYVKVAETILELEKLLPFNQDELRMLPFQLFLLVCHANNVDVIFKKRSDKKA